MNVTNNKNLTNTMPSSSAPLRVLEEDNQLLRQMLEALIDMYHMESALKKHHKAYLHIREEAEEMCDMFTMLRTLEKLEKSGGGVIFTMNAYDKAVDDMLCLCEGIDIMMEVMKAVFSGEPVTKQAVEQLMSMIQCMADEICERWSEMER